MKTRKRTVGEFIRERMFTGQVTYAHIGEVVLELERYGSIHFVQLRPETDTERMKRQGYGKATHLIYAAGNKGQTISAKAESSNIGQRDIGDDTGRKG